MSDKKLAERVLLLVTFPVSAGPWHMLAEYRQQIGSDQSKSNVQTIEFSCNKSEFKITSRPAKAGLQILHARYFIPSISYSPFTQSSSSCPTTTSLGACGAIAATGLAEVQLSCDTKKAIIFRGSKKFHAQFSSPRKGRIDGFRGIHSGPRKLCKNNVPRMVESHKGRGLLFREAIQLPVSLL
jgi:hypothetical protein